MRRLLRFELKKVVGKRLFWGLFFLAFGLNIIMLWWVNKGDTYTPGFNDCKSVYTELRPLDDTGKLQALQKEKSVLEAIRQKEQLEIDRALSPDSPAVKSEEEQYAAVYRQYKNILDQKQDYRQAERKSQVVDEALSGLATVTGYPEYLDGISREASRLTGFSVFGAKQEDSFSSRNIQKTFNDYEPLGSVKPSYDIDKGVCLIVDFPATDIFLLLTLLAICLCLITDEKDKGLFALIKCTKNGTGRTIAAKLAALFVLVLFVNTLVFTSSAAFAQASYGLGDLSRPVQSLPAMIGATLRLSVGQYLLLLFAVKTIGLAVVGMVILLFTQLSRHPILSIAGTILLAVASVCILLLIPATSGLNWLRVLNAACLVEPNRVLGQYCNLNLFGYPVGSIPVFLAFTVFLLLLMIAVNAFVFIRKKELSGRSSPLKAVISRIRIFQPRVHSHFAWYEVRKIAGVNLAALILILFSLFQWFSAQNSSISLSADDYYYRHYMVTLAGKITPEKETFLKNEKAKYDAVHAEIQKIGESYEAGKITWEDKINQESSYDHALSGEASLSKVYDRYLYIQKHPGTQFVYDLGYEKLFGITDPDNGLDSGIRLMIVLALCMCGVFSIEYRTGMFKVLGTTPKGAKSTVICKLVISAVVSILLFVCAYLPDFILVGKTYGFGGLSVPLSGLPSFENLGCFSILGYIVLLLGTRLLVCLAVSCMILALSLLIRNSGYTALTALCIFAGPPLLHMVGIHLFDKASVIPLLTANTYYLCGQSIAFSAAQITIAGILTALSLLVLLRRFGKSDTVKFSVPLSKHR